MKRRWKLGTIGLAVILVSFVAWERANAQQEELDPVKIAPDVQKVVFENALVRVTEERMPPAAPSASIGTCMD
jgi:hypothetical protein